MYSTDDFENTSIISKLLFKLVIATVCAIVGSIYWILFSVFYDESYTLPKLWIVLNILVILVIGGIVVNKLRLEYRNILAAGAFAFLLFPIFWSVFPVKIPQEYVGLRKINEEGFIVADEYCNEDCGYSQKLISEGYHIERSFYSWRYAELLGRMPSKSHCCYNRPFESKYLFGFLVLAEITFEYYPIIIALTLLLTTIEYYRDESLDVFGIDFVSKNTFNLKKVNLYGSTLILLILVYNLIYMQYI